MFRVNGRSVGRVPPVRDALGIDNYTVRTRSSTRSSFIYAYVYVRTYTHIARARIRLSYIHVTRTFVRELCLGAGEGRRNLSAYTYTPVRARYVSAFRKRHRVARQRSRPVDDDDDDDVVSSAFNVLSYGPENSPKAGGMGARAYQETSARTGRVHIVAPCTEVFSRCDLTVDYTRRFEFFNRTDPRHVCGPRAFVLGNCVRSS